MRDETLNRFAAALDVLRPGVGVAFAGPVTFADALNDWIDQQPQALEWNTMVAALNKYGRVLWPAPGSLLSLESGRVVHENLRVWATLTGSRPIVRIEEADDPLLARPAPDPQTLLDAAWQLAARLADILARLPGAQNTGAQTSSTKCKWVSTLVLSAMPRLATIETDTPCARVVIAPGRAALLAADESLPVPNLEIASLGSILVDFARGVVDLDSLLASGRARCSRVPDRFDSLLHNLLRYGNDPGCVESLVAWYVARQSDSPTDPNGPASTETKSETNVETLIVRVGGQDLVIPRYCPHEGAALDSAEIVDGRIVCPRHRWAFDLHSGQCVVGDPRVRLFARRPAPAPALPMTRTSP